MFDTIENCMRIATVYHNGQTDKAGAPYTNHLKRVAQRALYELEANNDEPLLLHKIMIQGAGYLHDIIEDTDLIISELRTLLEDIGSIMEESIVELVRVLTRQKGETYFDYIYRIADDSDNNKENYLAILIKIADIKDHLDSSTNGYTLPESMKQRYTKALSILETAKKEMMD